MGRQGTDDYLDTTGYGQLQSEIKKIIEFHKSGLSDTRIDTSRMSDEEQGVGSLFNEILDQYQLFFPSYGIH